jgi:hypothetical protein
MAACEGRSNMTLLAELRYFCLPISYKHDAPTVLPLSLSLARALKRVLPYNGRGVHPLQPRFVLLNI